MAETALVIKALKKVLRSQQMTYAHVAEGLGMSEANVKRMFAAERMTLDRIEAICTLLDMNLSDLFQLYEDSRQRISQLTKDQENELVADTRLLLVAVSVRNHLSFEEILAHYHIGEAELIQCLAKLDRLKIIDLLPSNKIKLRIDENFRWIPGGPIDKFYEKAIQQEFLSSGFKTAEEPRLFLYGLFSEKSQAIIAHRMQALSHEITQLHRQDKELPMSMKKSVGALCAIRQWEFSVLKPYSKNKG